MIGIDRGFDFNDQGSGVTLLAQLIDEFAEVDDSLADANLEVIAIGIAEVDILNVREQFFIIAGPVRLIHVLAGIKRQAQAFDVATNHGHGVNISGQMSELAAHPDPNPVPFGNLGESFELFDFLVEWRSVFAARHRKRDDFDRLGQLATFGKLFEVFFPNCLELETESGQIQTPD